MPSLKGLGITGFEEIQKSLSELPARVQKNVTKNAVYKGATTIRDEARANVVVDSGALKSKIIAKVKRLKDGTFFASAGVASGTYAKGKREGKTPRRYAHLVEFGTAHSAASPFMRPIIDNPDEIIRTVFDEMQISFNQQIAKIQAKG